MLVVVEVLLVLLQVEQAEQVVAEMEPLTLTQEEVRAYKQEQLTLAVAAVAAVVILDQQLQVVQESLL